MKRIAIIMLAFVTACTKKEEPTVTLMKQAPALPPLDAQAPAVVETATFGMG